ncbi:MAG: hypothetical protein KatS3mg005_3560 [Bryobacteraceae bacterium]|nr:MAG: hypothetical protein KatS3mg005_3560 [Bryobacteraceae bacterium]
MTVRGPVSPGSLGLMLPHEHLFSNFGEEPAEPPHYDEAALLREAVPYARRVKVLGCRALADATAAWFGRSPALLKTISEKTGLHILTNTGCYGAASDRYVPQHAFEEDAARLAGRWVREWREGIAGTGVRPGFIKTGEDAGPLSEIDAKLVRAGGRRPMRPYTLLFEKALPELRRAGLTDAEIRGLTRDNPARAFTVRRRLAG